LVITVALGDGSVQIVLGKLNANKSLFRSIVAEEIFHASELTTGLMSIATNVDRWKGEVRAQEFVLDSSDKLKLSSGRKGQLRNYQEGYQACVNGTPLRTFECR